MTSPSNNTEYNYTSKDEQIAAFFDSVKEKVQTDDPFEIVCAMASKGQGRKAAIAENIDDILSISHESRPIQNIALYHVSLRRDGIGRVVSNLCRVLTDSEKGKKYNLIVVTDDEPSDEDYPLPLEIKRVVIPPYSKCRNNYALRAKALQNLVSLYEIDAFIYSAWLEQGFLWDMLTVKTNPRHPAFFVHIHSFCSKIWRYTNNCVEETWTAFALTDGIITLSEADRDYWKHVNPNTYLLWNPVIRSQERQKNQYKKGPHHVVWLGRISDEKQPLEMVRIMKYVVKQKPDTICHIVGRLDPKNPLANNLQKYIKTCHLEDNVLLEGFRTDVETFYRESDIYVSTSDYEGFPMTFMESASFGLPTVIYDLPWIEYYKIIDGWVSVKEYDASKMADTIVRILNDPDEWETRSTALYESYQRFESHDFAQDWVEIFDNFESGKKPEPLAPARDFSVILAPMTKFHSAAVRAAGKGKNQNLDKIYKSATWKVGNLIIQPLHLAKKLVSKLRSMISPQ